MCWFRSCYRHRPTKMFYQLAIFTTNFTYNVQLTGHVQRAKIMDKFPGKEIRPVLHHTVFFVVSIFTRIDTNSVRVNCSWFETTGEATVVYNLPAHSDKKKRPEPTLDWRTHRKPTEKNRKNSSDAVRNIIRLYFITIWTRPTLLISPSTSGAWKYLIGAKCAIYKYPKSRSMCSWNRRFWSKPLQSGIFYPYSVRRENMCINQN